MPFRESYFIGPMFAAGDLKGALGYIANGKDPILPPGMRDHLKEDLDKSFDF